ncbi:MAG TPA: glycoside hydrolase domain-containing protein [Puia sp.]|nr:glycoside hydrolase domain-containing protein [Puia sp.]
MKSVSLRVGLCLVAGLRIFVATAQQNIELSKARFSTGDHSQWKERSFNDTGWKTIQTGMTWEEQGYPDYDGYAWYRIHFKLPSSLRKNALKKDSLRIYLGKIDDVDETFLNDHKIGQTGAFPTDAGGYSGAYYTEREYYVPLSGNLLQWDQENVLAIRVYDGGGGGGMSGKAAYVNMVDVIDALRLTSTTKPGNHTFVTLQNKGSIAIKGKLLVQVKDIETGGILRTIEQPVSLPAFRTMQRELVSPGEKIVGVSSRFTQATTGKTIGYTMVLPYILTPPAPLKPRINGPIVFGVRVGSPLLFRIPATGKKPLRYEVKGLPVGLQVDESTGIISGRLDGEGVYVLRLSVSNSLGMDERNLTIKVGQGLALTPPMGWNSWNCWGVNVSAEKVESSAQALIDKGLVGHGWGYMNIDDGWQSPQRAADGRIVANEKFPDMKALGDWLHVRGLKFGVYSSPGPLTCGHYTGSWQHEAQDARSYADWGVDYLKYDWCSYGEIAGNDSSLDVYIKPYRIMQQGLQAQNRDIYYSLCQYGMRDVWKWGPSVAGNSWRTTGDITDTWESLFSTGFVQGQDKLYPYAQPGHWNDPDMLIVGQVGWGSNLHPTRLTPDEQYTHISLWCLLSAPLLIGCDLSKLDDFTIGLLTNDEVLAIDQDTMGKQARRVVQEAGYQVWVKELADGSRAIGIFNTGDDYKNIVVKWSQLALSGGQRVRDLWRQKESGLSRDSFTTKVAPHGVRLIRVKPMKEWPVPVMVSYGSPDIRYKKSEAPAIRVPEMQWTVAAWKGEKVSTQVLLWGSKALGGVRLVPGALRSKTGVVLPASQVSYGFVRYVMTDGLNKEGGGCGIGPAAGSDSSLVADGIDFRRAKDVAPNTVQPIWVSLEVPRTLPAGVYSGTLQVIGQGVSRTLSYRVDVKDHLLPSPDKWTYHIDLWQNPYAIARVHGTALWSKEHFAAMKPYMKMLAAAGQKTITVSMIYDPWRGQTYDIYGSMIKWIKKRDNSWEYDYTVFDKWVGFMMQQGIGSLINCYTMVPWNNKFYYYDEANGKDTVLIAAIGSPEYMAHWRPMLIDFRNHLKAKGWFEKTAIAMDERALEDMQKVIALVKGVDTAFKLSLAGSYHPEIEKDIYDYSIGSADHFDSVTLQRRIGEGRPTTYYTCCVEGHPNTFTFSSPAEAEWLGWYAANKHYNGYLRWAYNSWPRQPLQDSRFGTWSAGDTYFIYPGAGSSIRFERLREGIQDYEKIRLLRAFLMKTHQAAALEKLQALIGAFDMGALRSMDAADQLQRARVVLNELSGK